MRVVGPACAWQQHAKLGRLSAAHSGHRHIVLDGSLFSAVRKQHTQAVHGCGVAELGRRRVEHRRPPARLGRLPTLDVLVPFDGYQFSSFGPDLVVTLALGAKTNTASTTSTLASRKFLHFSKNALCFFLFFYSFFQKKHAISTSWRRSATSDMQISLHSRKATV